MIIALRRTIGRSDFIACCNSRATTPEYATLKIWLFDLSNESRILLRASTTSASLPVVSWLIQPFTADSMVATCSPLSVEVVVRMSCVICALTDATLNDSNAAAVRAHRKHRLNLMNDILRERAQGMKRQKLAGGGEGVKRA